MNKNGLLIISILVAFVLPSCQKEEDVDIVYGNTNMLSKTLTVYGSQWYFVDPTYIVDIVVPEITQDVVDNGAVMAYYRNGYGEWQAMPITNPMDNTYASVYAFSFWNGHVSLYKTDTDLLTLSPTDMDVKLVIFSLKSEMENYDIDWSNYSEVSAHFNLK